MTQDELKALVGQAATAYVQPGSVIGVGTGTTVSFFIDALAKMQEGVAAAVSSSEQSSQRLRESALASGFVTAEQFDAWVRPADMVGAPVLPPIIGA